MSQDPSVPEAKNRPGQISLPEKQDILEDAPVGIFTSTPAGGVSYANKTLARMLGYESPRGLIAAVTDIATQIYANPRDRKEFQRLVDMHGEVKNYECRFLDCNGAAFWVSINARSVSGRKASTTCYHGFVTDIDEHKRAEKALQESRNLLAKAQEIAHIGSWELDLQADRLTWTDEVYRIFGLHPQEFGATYRAFLDHVHPDDRARVDAAYVKSLNEGKDTYEIQHRVIRKNTGEIREVYEKCFHERDSSGRIIRSVGMIQDVTKLKRAEEALQKSEERFQKMLALVPDMISIQDADMNIVYSNWKGIAEVPEQNRALGTKCYRTYRGYDHVCPDCLPISVIDSKQAFQEEIKLPDGGWLDLRIIPILDAQGNVECFVEWARDITQQKRLEERLQALATIDDLTNLWNRRYFLNKATHEIERAKRYGTVFSVLILDIDDFKNINDTYGHAAGDAVLKHFAAKIKDSLRQADLSGRLGGEEFGILLPNTGIDDAYLLAERLRRVTEKTPGNYADNDLFITASIGVAVYRRDLASVDELFLEADKALYKAKTDGKNRVRKTAPG
ncbi:MAG: diguanylate cyclase [Desulfobacterales bacterium]|nr:diguanylate cyclase [Desulfobacterales bacterium]